MNLIFKHITPHIHFLSCFGMQTQLMKPPKSKENNIVNVRLKRNNDVKNEQSQSSLRLKVLMWRQLLYMPVCRLCVMEKRVFKSYERCTKHG